MPVLLEGLSPKLSADVISQCKNIGVTTVTDFVTSNVEELSKKTKVPFKDLVRIKHDLISSKGCFPQRADSLFTTLLETMHIISTGNDRMNSFLKGGIYAGEVTEIHGRAGSGKTQFCLSVTASTVLDSDSTVLYLNSTCDFSAQRIEQILRRKSEDRQTVAEKMKRIKIINIIDIYHLFDILDYIKCSLKKMDHEFFKHLKLIVFDSITQIMAPCFGGKYIDGPGLMANVARLFKLICSEHMIAMLVSNNTVLGDNSNIKAGLGPNWKYVPSVSLLISKVEEMKLHKLITAKSCRNGLYKELTFSITEAGISD